MKEAAANCRELQEPETQALGVSCPRPGAIHAERCDGAGDRGNEIRYHHSVETNINTVLLNIVAMALGIARTGGPGVECSLGIEGPFEVSLRTLPITKANSLSRLEQVPSRPLPAPQP